MATDGSLLERALGAARLNVETYEEVERDESATTQAAIVVAIVAIAQAIGMAGRGGPGILGGVIAALAGWVIWSGITWFIGDKLFGGTATWGELLRTIGFAQAPGALYALAIIPGLGWLVRGVVAVWVLIAGIIAIRQALDFSTGKAILTAVIGWLVPVAIMALLGGFARIF